MIDIVGNENVGAGFFERLGYQSFRNRRRGLNSSLRQLRIAAHFLLRRARGIAVFERIRRTTTLPFRFTQETRSSCQATVSALSARVHPRAMKTRFTVLVIAVLGLLFGNAKTQNVLFDFDSAPLHSPLPIDLTVGGITAHLSSGTPGYNYSVQPADILGFTPAGFSGYCIYPNQIYLCDLKISFDHAVTDTSVLYAPQEYATDSSCTMRITAYSGTTQVATNTYTNPNPGTWPSATLSLSSAQPFDNVVIHYDAPPVTGGDYGPIFMVDNLQVTLAPTSCIAPPTGLVSWWPGDGNTNDIQGSNIGTLMGSATYAAGLVGQAFILMAAKAASLKYETALTAPHSIPQAHLRSMAGSILIRLLPETRTRSQP